MPDHPTPSTEDTAVGRLVERWLPGGTKVVRSVTGRHRFAVVVAIVVVVAAIVTAVVLSARGPSVESAPALPPAVSAGTDLVSPVAPSSLVVSVIGKVMRPGLVTVTPGARIADAIQAAGGVLPGTDDSALNLARRLADGEQIDVGQPAPTPQPDAADPGSADPDAAADPANPDATTVDINTATEEELETLPGIGPTMAERILTYRGQHGHFDSVSQLRNVQGIGPARFAKIQQLVTT
jgi:competence protein ComEA